MPLLPRLRWVAWAAWTAAAAGVSVHAAEAIALFDGKTLAGWEGDLSLWKVEAGMITAGSRTEKVARNVFLATTRSFQDFDLTLKLRLSGTEGFVNSGVQIRSVRVPGSTEMSGYQVDAGEKYWGTLYDESRRNRTIATSLDLAAVLAAVKKDDWNEFRIRVEGPHIRTWINGVAAIDYLEADPAIAQDGSIALQVHGGGKTLVEAKDIVVRELPAKAGAPTWDQVGRPTGEKPGGQPAPATAPTGGTAAIPEGKAKQAPFLFW